MAALIGDILAESAARVPTKAAVIAGGDSITYEGLDARANRIANALNAAGVGKGGMAAVLSTNRIDYPAIFYGTARSGAVLAHMSVRYTADDLVYLIEHTGIETLFVHAEQAPLAAEARPRAKTLKRLIVFGGTHPAADATLEDFIADAPETPPATRPDPDDPVAITYTGGTTGFPKAVLATHRARIASVTVAANEFCLTEDDVMFATTPLFHIVGLFIWFQCGISLGCTMVLLDKWSPDGFIDTVEREAITAAFLVPTQITAVLNHPEFTPDRVKSLRYINYGGSPAPVTLVETLSKLFPKMVLIEHYGQSEAAPLTVRPPEFARAKPASVGRPFQGFEVRIVDETGRDAPAGTPGEIVTRGPHLLKEYYKDPDQTAALYIEDGWLRTGDVGYMDGDGFLHIIDRSKDMIISGGENIFPTEIENALYQHEAVKECAVFGIPDAQWGELPAAHVVLADGENATEEDLVEFVAARIARHKRPRLVKFVDALPKTAVGKIQKNVIRAPYWEQAKRAI